jgi:hypothetical protein
MRHLVIAAFLTASAFVVSAAPKTPVLEKVAVDRLQQAFAAAPGKTDAELTQQLSTFELTERMSPTVLAQLSVRHCFCWLTRPPSSTLPPQRFPPTLIQIPLPRAKCWSKS